MMWNLIHRCTHGFWNGVLWLYPTRERILVVQCLYAGIIVLLGIILPVSMRTWVTPILVLYVINIVIAVIRSVDVQHENMGEIHVHIAPHRAGARAWLNQQSKPLGTLIINCPRDGMFMLDDTRMVSVSEMYETWRTAINVRQYLCMQLLEEVLPVQGIRQLIVEYERISRPHVLRPEHVNEKNVFEFCALPE